MDRIVLITGSFSDVDWTPLYSLVRSLESVLPGGRFENRLRFEKRLDPVGTIFTPIAGELESAPRRLRIIGHAIDHNATGSYLRGDATRPLEIGAQDRPVEAIL